MSSGWIFYHGAIMLTIADAAPDFSLPGVHQGKVRNYSLREARGHWLLLGFYLHRFTLGCSPQVNRLC